MLHGFVARALEALDPGGVDAHSTSLARHYREAEVWDKAAEHLTRSAETAAHRYAHAEAMAALQEADRYLQHLPAGDRDRRHLDLVLRQCDEVGRTHLALAELMPLRGDREGAVRHLQAAHRLFTALRVSCYVMRAEAVAREFQISLDPVSPRSSC